MGISMVSRQGQVIKAQGADITLLRLQENATFVFKSEKVTKIFIKKHSSRMKNKCLTTIDTKNGVSDDPDVVSKAACSFYEDFYSNWLSSELEPSLNTWLFIVPPGLPIEIIHSISKEELLKVVKTL